VASPIGTFDPSKLQKLASELPTNRERLYNELAQTGRLGNDYWNFIDSLSRQYASQYGGFGGAGPESYRENLIQKAIASKEARDLGDRILRQQAPIFVE
jgi:hypothetical protein